MQISWISPCDPSLVKNFLMYFGNQPNNFKLFLVGNIPYEATEEKLKDIFAEVGQVLSFK